MKRHLPLVLIAGFCLLALAYGRQGFAVQQPPIQQNPPVVSVPGTVGPSTTTTVPSQPAVPVAQVSSPAAPLHFEDQAIWALMVSMLIQWLKKSPWFGWIKPGSEARLKTQFGFIAACATAVGVHFSITGSLFAGDGASLTVTGISVNAFKDVVWQWAAQQAWYQAIIKEPKVVEVAKVA